MGALIDLTGQTFGMLTVKTRLPDKITRSGARQPVWGCVCVCGRRSAEEGRALRSHRALSCRRCVRDPSRMLRYGRVYLVYFPREQVLKIGFHTSTIRIKELIEAGGIRIDEYRDVDKSWERVGREALDEIFMPAFTSRDDARHVLPRGAGWTDCFTVTPDDLDLAKHVVMWAGIKKGNDFGENPPATPLWRRALDGIQHARRAARSRSTDTDRPTDPDERRLPDPARHPLDRRTAIPGRALGLGSRPDHPRCAPPRGHRPRPHLGPERPRMARPLPTWLHPKPTCTHRTLAHTRTALAGPIFIGLGERERKRTRARGCTRTGTRARAGRGPGAGRPLGSRVLTNYATCTPRTARSVASAPAGMPGSPQRDGHGGVRAMRHSGRATTDLPRSGQVRTAAGLV